MKREERAKDALRRLGVRPSKARGQNFIIDEGALEAIVEFGAPRPGERIVEIGPGLGQLTGRLAGRGLVGLIEIEESFCNELRARYPDLRILNQDVRTVDFCEFGEAVTVFGNLPYSLSTEIVFHLLDSRRAIRRAVLLLQREFVDRMTAEPGGREYGALSIGAQLWSEAIRGPVITGDAFHPPANVESRVVELRMRERPAVEVGDETWFKRVVKAAFLQRRRKLPNSLRGSGLFSAEQVSEALSSVGIDENRRAETLSLEEFARLAAALRRRE